MYFPLFVSLNNQTIVIIGGGKIATRRLKTLLHFECFIKIISPEVTASIEELCKAYPGQIRWVKRIYQSGDLIDAFMVIAATSNEDLNRRIGEEAHKHHQYVSVASNKALCNFYFPAVIFKDSITIGLTSQGKDTKGLAKFSQTLRLWLKHMD